MPQVDKYTPDWESLKQYTIPEWFRNAKLGIFVHWGPYAVPAAFTEWYPKHMYNEECDEFAHHRKTWGDHKEFGYKDFIPLFTGEKWDPEQWVSLFKRTGARYVVPVAEHHDGFPMYSSPFTEWNSVKMGPKRDVVAELEAIVRREGLKFGVSSHRAYNWRYFTFKDEFDTVDPRYAGLYGQPHPPDQPASQEFIEDWYNRTTDLIDRFEPDLLWFDFGWGKKEFHPWHPRVTSYYYNRALEWDREVVLNYKWWFPEGAAVFDIERGKLNELREEYWQTDTSISYKTWSYAENDDFKSVTTIVHDLVDIVSKNGNLLLNVGPRADGTICSGAEKRLTGLGEWLDVNGEAIFDTHHWETFGEGDTVVGEGQMKEKEDVPFTAQDIRFTRKNGSLYAMLLGWPEGDALIRSLGVGSSVPAERIERIRMLGSGKELEWTQSEDGLSVRPPSEKPCGHAYTMRVELKD